MAPALRALFVALLALLLFSLHASEPSAPAPGRLRISADGSHFEEADGTPFFWLADTGWLITQKLRREELVAYFENRRAKGFNVIQCCILQFPNDKTAYGAPALTGGDILRPATTPGADPADPVQYDYWDHVDYAVDAAAKCGLRLAIAPVWSHMVRRTPITAEQAASYTSWLAARYKERTHIIWLNGGSAKGTQDTAVWQSIGQTLKRIAPGQLVGFHTFGRTQSSTWFHDASWLDFNTFTSGHRRYDQDTEGRAFGEDNWRYVLEDLARVPRKPTLDAEPAYENTPQGLHDSTQPRWTANDTRRYAWWSVFAGSAGHSFGENSVRQVFVPGEAKSASGAVGYFKDRLDSEGAGQMRHLRDWVKAHPGFAARTAFPEALVGEPGLRYDRILVTRGPGFLMAYTYTGRSFELRLGHLPGDTLRASWFNPRTGATLSLGSMPNSGTKTFDPPDEKADGNDWVLLLEPTSGAATRGK